MREESSQAAGAEGVTFSFSTVADDEAVESPCSSAESFPNVAYSVVLKPSTPRKREDGFSKGTSEAGGENGLGTLFISVKLGPT